MGACASGSVEWGVHTPTRRPKGARAWTGAREALKGGENERRRQQVGSSSHALLVIVHGRAVGLCEGAPTRRQPVLLVQRLWRHHLSSAGEPWSDSADGAGAPTGGGAPGAWSPAVAVLARAIRARAGAAPQPLQHAALRMPGISPHLDGPYWPAAGCAVPEPVATRLHKVIIPDVVA